jgi:hypothetical protein
MRRALTAPLLVPLCLAALATTATAQVYRTRPVPPPPYAGPQLSAMVLYQFGGTLTTLEGDLSLADGEAFAATLTLPVRPGARAEAYYGYQRTTLSRRQAGGGLQELAPMDVHVFQVGGTYEPRVAVRRLQPFFVTTAGAVLYDAREDATGEDYGSDWEFAFRLALGTTVKLSARAGFRAEVGALVPIFWADSHFGCGGAGCYGTISGTTSMIQGLAGGGVTVTF